MLTYQSIHTDRALQCRLRFSTIFPLFWFPGTSYRRREKYQRLAITISFPTTVRSISRFRPLDRQNRHQQRFSCHNTVEREIRCKNTRRTEKENNRERDSVRTATVGILCLGIPVQQRTYQCFGHSVDSLLPVCTCCHASKKRSFSWFFLLLNLNQ